jgi:hypothetical protein
MGSSSFIMDEQGADPINNQIGQNNNTYNQRVSEISLENSYQNKSVERIYNSDMS